MTLREAIQREVNSLLMSGEWMELTSGEVAARIEAAVLANQALNTSRED
jgi:hypothetical protein